MSASPTEMLTYIEQKWESIGGLIAAVILALVLEAVVLDNPTEWIVQGISATLILIVWLLHRRSPRADKGKLGFAIAITCEDREVETRIREDFIRTINELLAGGRTGSTIQPLIVPNREACEITGIEDANRIRRKCRAQFMLYGRVRKRDVSGKLRTFIDLKGLVAHREIPSETQARFSREFSELLPARVLIGPESDIFAFELTSVLIEVVAKYIIGIAAALSGDLNYAEKLYRDVGDQLNHAPDLHPYQKLKERTPIRLSELEEERARIAYIKWEKSRSERDAKAIGDHLDKVGEQHRDRPQFTTLSSIYLFVVKKDVDESLELLRQNRHDDDPAWNYNVAFLEAYKGNLRRAVEHYKRLESLPNSPVVTNQIEEFLGWMIECEPDLPQVHFCLGYYNWKIKGDLAIAKAEFEDFIRKSDEQGVFAPEVSWVRRWIEKIES